MTSPAPATIRPSAAFCLASRDPILHRLGRQVLLLRPPAGCAVSRRFATGRGPYNLAVSPDGRYLVATLKQGGGVELFDLGTGASIATLKTSTTVTHGVVVSPDSRYAFVSSEGVRAEPGKVDVFDLAARVKVGTVDVGQQASGIAFWKMEPAR